MTATDTHTEPITAQTPVCLGSLTDEELIREAFNRETLTMLENELLQRFEHAVRELSRAPQLRPADDADGFGE